MATKSYYEQQEEELTKYYGDRRSALDKSYGADKDNLALEKSQAEQQAQITYEKMKNYIPQRLNSMGLYGQGIAPSVALQMENNYRNEIGDVSKYYSQQANDLKKAYNDDLADIDSAARNELLGYRQAQYKEQSQLGDQAYEDYLAMLTSGTWEKSEDAENAYNEFANYMTDYQKQSAKTYLDAWKNTDTQIQRDNGNTENSIANFKTGNGVYTKGDKSYKMYYALKDDANEFRDNKSFNMAVGSGTHKNGDIIHYYRDSQGRWGTAQLPPEVVFENDAAENKRINSISERGVATAMYLDGNWYLVSEI